MFNGSVPVFKPNPLVTQRTPLWRWLSKSGVEGRIFLAVPPPLFFFKNHKDVFLTGFSP